MALINEATLNSLRAVHDSALHDTCVRMVYSAGTGDYGWGAPSYSAGATLSCMVIPGRDAGSLPAEALDQVARLAPKIRFALGTTMSNTDRIKVTKLHGDTQAAPITYEIIGGPAITHVGIEFDVQKVTDGSE